MDTQTVVSISQLWYGYGYSGEPLTFYNEYSLSMFLDLLKAFDTVDHNISLISYHIVASMDSLTYSVQMILQMVCITCGVTH